MMIEDEELRDLYRISGEERLHRLETGLAQLEKYPGDASIFQRLQRDIHSLKGDSRSVGLDHIAALTQAVEEVLKCVQGGLTMTPPISNALYQGVTGIGRLVHEAVTGEPSEVDTEAISTVLRAALLEEAIDLPPLSLTFEEQTIDPADQAIDLDIDSTFVNSIWVLQNHSSEVTFLEGEAEEIEPEIELENVAAIENLVDEVITDEVIINEAIIDEDDEVIEETIEEEFSEEIAAEGISTEVTEDTDVYAWTQDIPVDELAEARSIEAFPDGLTGNTEKNGFENIVDNISNILTESRSENIADEAIAFHSGWEESGAGWEESGWPEPAPSESGTVTLIEDIELREIYRITSEERLQKLEDGLAQLEQSPDDEATFSVILRQLHSFKGDSRSVDLQVVERLSSQMEAIVERIQAHELILTPAISNCLYQTLDAIGQTVHEAVTGEPKNVDTDEILYLLNDTLAMPSAFPTDAPLSSFEISDSLQSDDQFNFQHDADLDAQFNAQLNSQFNSQSDSISIAKIGMIEDAELREIYRTTITERLEKLENSLVQLEESPNDVSALAELLREAHSLKGDSRSAGVEAVETLIHQFEEVLGSIQRREIHLTHSVSDCLYECLDAIEQIVWTAVTGASRSVDITQVLAHLQEAVSASTQKAGEIADAVPDASPALSDAYQQAYQEISQETSQEAYQIESIRVPTRDLDALMSQVEDLTVTRIQMAQTLSQAEQIALLWQEWKTSRSRNAHLGSVSLGINPNEEKLEQLINTLRTTAQENQANLDRITETLSDKVRTLRLLPLSTVFQTFPRVVRSLAKQQSKAVKLIIDSGETTADKQILEGIKDVLTHLIRNAIDHGIEPVEERKKLGKSPTARIWLRAYNKGNSVILEVADDGRGLDLEKIKQTAIRRKLYSADELEIMSPNQIQALILAPGFSTRTMITEISGRGVGLDVVRTTIERMKGSIQIESTPEQGCTFRLQISTSLTTLNTVLVEVQGILHALPFEALQSTRIVSPEQLISMENQDAIRVNGEPTPVVNLGDILELSKSPAYAAIAKPRSSNNDRQTCVLLKVGEQQAGFFVDRLLDTQEVVLKPQSRLLKRIRNVLGATTLSTGDVCMVLNPAELIQSVHQPALTPVTRRTKAIRRKPVILLVEDSPPVRIQEKRLFESAGYEVVVAVDGLEGYTLLKTREFDAIVSDIEMPHLDGLSLTAKIRRRPEYDELPIILVTTLSSDEDRRRGAEAGANAYIAKGKFNQEILLETLARLI